MTRRGSGTILIEAAMMAWNIAPGLRRSFPSEHWDIIGDNLWEDAREEAFDAVKDDIPRISPEAISTRKRSK